MPLASRILVRLALLHLVAGTGIGALLLLGKGMPQLATAGWQWRGAHADMLAVGFTLQLAIGVATWILPRDHDRPPSALPALLTCVLLNAGVLLASAGAVSGRPGLTAAGRILEAAGVAAFALHAGPRIRGVRDLPGLSGASPGRSR